MSRQRVDFDGRRLAEAVRFLERDGTAPLVAGTVAVQDDDLEAGVVTRARSVPVAGDVVAALGQVDAALRWVGAAVFLAALLAGGATAAAALAAPTAPGGGRTLNLIETLVALLGVQAAFLLAWLLLTVLRPRVRATSPLLWLPQAMLRRLARLGSRRPEAIDGRSRLAAAARATAEPLAAPGMGRATASVLTHATWTAFNLGALAVMIVLLSAREYRFSWETTLLDARTGERVVRTMLAGPAAAGVPGPDEAAIVRARPGAAEAQADEDRRAWATATLGIVAIYGLAPRLVLLAGSMAVRRHRRRRWRLDLDQPGYQVLRRSLQPAPTTNIEEPEDPRPPLPAVVGGRAADPDDEDPSGSGARAGAGDPVLLRLETDRPPVWPPSLEGVAWTDLGLVDGRGDEHRVLEEIEHLEPPPVRVLAVADLTITPDRGHERFLASVRDASHGRLRIVLSGGQAMRERSGGAAVTGRVDAWRTLARRLELAEEQVLELDLSHATESSLDRLDALLGPGRPGRRMDGGADGGGDGGGRAGGAASHLDSSLQLVVDAAAGWTTAPDAAAQAELHRSIQRRYRLEPARAARLLGLAGDGGGLAGRATEGARAAVRRLHDADPATLAESMRAAAGGMLDRLPPGLRASPRWAAAGAIAGACGCLAAAAAISPLAVTALPAWAGGGAVIAAVLRSVRTGAAGDAAAGAAAATATADPAGEAARVAADTGAAVDAAILLTLVLELQGRDEAVISRVLEATLLDASGAAASRGVPGAGAPLVPGDRTAVRARVDDVRERFDAAMAAEVAR